MSRRPPDHLKPSTKRWFRRVLKEYQLEEHHERVLQLACEAWDRSEEARLRIAQDGAYLPDRFGQLKAHPAIDVERDSRIAFMRALRELDLDVDPPAAEARPPQLRRYVGA